MPTINLSPIMGADPQNGHWSFHRSITDKDFGFIYVITNHLNDRKYVGCKQIKTVRKTDWRTYTGSNSKLNAEILKHGEKYFSFLILKVCNNKKELKYSELCEIVARDAIMKPEYYNEFISFKLRNIK